MTNSSEGVVEIVGRSYLCQFSYLSAFWPT